MNWNNDLTNFSLKGLTPSELDIFLGICYRCQHQGTRTIKIAFDELRGLSYFLSKDGDRFCDKVIAVNKKLLSLSNSKKHTHFVCREVIKWQIHQIIIQINNRIFFFHFGPFCLISKYKVRLTRLSLTPHSLDYLIGFSYHK